MSNTIETQALLRCTACDTVIRVAVVKDEEGKTLGMRLAHDCLPMIGQ